MSVEATHRNGVGSALSRSPQPSAPDVITTEPELAALALALDAKAVDGWSPAEQALTRRLPTPNDLVVSIFRKAIIAGCDPLGDVFCALRSPVERRARGAVYTPPHI